MTSIIFDTDSYKLHHFGMYPDGTERVYSYFECRTGAKYNRVKMVGLQPITRALAQQITIDDLLEAFEMSKEHGLPLNLAGWNYIIDEHNGYLPLEIKAIPEGMVS